MDSISKFNRLKAAWRTSKHCVHQIYLIITTKGIVNDESVDFFIPRHGLELKTYLPTSDISALHHLARYNWAIEVLKLFPKRTVLDIACGAGYGAYLMALEHPQAQVIGADINEKALEFAKQNYCLPNLRFVPGDIQTWTNLSSFDDLGMFEVITCFDTLEHIPHRELALKHLSSHLDDDGYLLFSTPCGSEYTNFTPDWHHHLIEYSHYDVYDLMRRYFKEVYRSEDNNLPAYSFWTDVINVDKLLYDNTSNPPMCKTPIRI